MKWEFATTSWSQVLAAQGGSSTSSRQALETLCRAYWYPLYAFVRLQGNDPEASLDLTQAYFTELLEKDYLKDVDPSLGRFRAFLKVSVKHFLSKERDKARALKRGGQAKIFSFDADDRGTLPLRARGRAHAGRYLRATLGIHGSRARARDARTRVLRSRQAG